MAQLPRKAALVGCVVITNMEGGAVYDKNVPLLSMYKFRAFDVGGIHALLWDVCRSGRVRYGEHVKRMRPYVGWIHGQEDRMRERVDRLIDEVVASCIDNWESDSG
ncbi:hypothetical protein ACHAW5_001478 [Stephanodiscus triporus]|uniref:Uncharacterized protein n=1 Tax=Stephanodiscus triporus TaxID=2934178 RepID=A0ABD3ML97_9STRA